MTRNIILILVLIIAILAIAFIVRNYAKEEEPILVTMEGRVVCLPQTSAGPATLECAYGLSVSEDTTYALNLSSRSVGSAGSLIEGELIEVSGSLMLREELEESDRFLKYDMEGVILVSTVRMLESAATSEQHVAAGGVLAFSRPEDFGLAVTEDQMPQGSVIPPCAETFDYCLYYNDPAYAGTNFQSAGLRITERADLATPEECLATEPDGYTNLVSERTVRNGYEYSVFSPIRDAGAGHASEGELFRLSFADSCYEFETRIGTSQLGNFEPGEIDAFTESNRASVLARLAEALSAVRIVGRESERIF